MSDRVRERCNRSEMKGSNNRNLQSMIDASVNGSQQLPCLWITLYVRASRGRIDNLKTECKTKQKKFIMS